MKKLLVLFALVFASPAFAQVPSPYRVNTLTANGTISVTNTFQQALAVQIGGRHGCTLQNQGTHTQFVYFGAIGSATTTNAFQLSPGQTISCAAWGTILQDAVNITGTAGDTYVVTNQ